MAYFSTLDEMYGLKHDHDIHGKVVPYLAGMANSPLI